MLAGGIAHKFNNLAAGIVGYAQLALSNPTDESLKRSAHFSSELGQKVADAAAAGALSM